MHHTENAKAITESLWASPAIKQDEMAHNESIVTISYSNYGPPVVINLEVGLPKRQQMVNYLEMPLKPPFSGTKIPVIKMGLSGEAYVLHVVA